ncbi:MAG: apolipoprotein N-acyltransferase [Sphingomonadaceae bacterium]
MDNPVEKLRHLILRPGLLALLLGAVAACGFQPLALWWLTILALAALIPLAANAKGPRGAFLIGWLFGVGHFTIGNFWIATAFTYQAEMPHWLGGIAVVLLSLYLAIYPALATLGAWALIRARSGYARSWFGLAFAGMWIVTEWMRAGVFTGFAWNPLGIVLLGGYERQGLAVIAKWIGTYALSGVVVAIAALLEGAWRKQSMQQGRDKLKPIIAMVVVALPTALAMHLPASHLDRIEGARAFTLVQPDLRQPVLDDPALYEANYQKLAALTLPEKPNSRRIVFWPESGLADYLRDGYEPRHYSRMTYAADPVVARERIGRAIGPYSLLLTGAVDLVIEDRRAVAARNSVTALDYKGRILAGYSKAHLVPYGEYLPMRAILEPLGLSRLVPGSLDFRAGPGPRTLDFGDWGKAGVQICYEIVFSGEVVDPLVRPEYIFNPSNDGWFGAWGPPQHLAQARLRAIEEGLPVLRSTTTGISAVIDADGIVRQHVPHHQAGRIDGMIPPPAEPTLFARGGNLIPLLIAALLLLTCTVAIVRTKS